MQPVMHITFTWCEGNQELAACRARSALYPLSQHLLAPLPSSDAWSKLSAAFKRGNISPRGSTANKGLIESLATLELVKNSKKLKFFSVMRGKKILHFLRVFDKLKCSENNSSSWSTGKLLPHRKVIQRRGGKGENWWRILWSKEELTADRAQTPKDLRKKWSFIEIFKKNIK